MGNVILCAGALVKNSYYVKEACIRLFSAEELCYYVYHYAYLLTDDFVSDKLVRWVREELKLEKTADKIESIRDKKNALENLVRILNNEIGYYSEEEWKGLIAEIENSSSMSYEERRKVRADGLLSGGKFSQALEEYENIIREEKIDDDRMRAGIYHNMGVCSAKLFLFERAAHYLEEAYNAYANTESYHEMLCAMKMYMEPTEYLNYLSEHKESYEDSLEVERKFEILKLSWGEQAAYKYFRELERQKEDGGSYYESVDRLVDDVKETYRGYINGSW